MSEDVPQLRIKPPSLLDRVKESPVTIVLTLLNIGWFVFAEMHGRTEQTSVLIHYGAVERIHVWSGEYWRVASYMFLHIGWLHILWNTWASFSLCAGMERAFGWWRYLFVYLAAGIGGGCLSAITSHAVTAGASGAMYGVLGSLLAVQYHQHGDFKSFINDKAVRSTIVQVVIWSVVLGVSMSVSNAAHAGGFVVGVGATFAILRRSTVLRFLLGVAMIGLLLGAFKPWWVPTGNDRELTKQWIGLHLELGDRAEAERIAKKACGVGIEEACDLSTFDTGKKF